MIFPVLRNKRLAMHKECDKDKKLVSAPSLVPSRLFVDQPDAFPAMYVMLLNRGTVP